MKKLLLFAGLSLLPFTAQAQAPAAVNGCQYNSSAPALADKQTVVFQCDTNGALIIAGFNGGAPLSTNLTEIGGNTVDVGPGTGGSATLRTILDSTQTIPAGTAGTPASAALTVQGIASMTPVAAGALGSGTGGALSNLKTCDLHAKYDASDNGSITLVTGVSSRKVYICGYVLATGGTATNLKLREGSDANCATNGADLTPAYQLVANDKIGVVGSFWSGLVTSTNAYYVCVNASAGNAHQAEIFYTTQ